MLGLQVSKCMGSRREVLLLMFFCCLFGMGMGATREPFFSNTMPPFLLLSEVSLLLTQHRSFSNQFLDEVWRCYRLDLLAGLGNC